MMDDLGRGFGNDSDTGAYAGNGAESGARAFTGAAGDDSLTGQAQINVAKPTAGETVQITTEAGQTYVLDFDPAEAQALVQGDNLVLIFPDGGRIVFEGLVALVQQDDGPSLLVAGTDLIPLLVAQGIIPGVLQGFELNEPDAGETVVITAEAGQRYIIKFNPAIAQVQVDGDDLVLVFPNGGRIVIQDLGTLAGGPNEPVFDIAGNEIPGGTLFGQALALTGEEAGPEAPTTLETAAAGEAPDSGGVGDYEDDPGDPINLLNPQGVIPPRELSFGVPQLEPGPVEPLAEPEAPPPPPPAPTAVRLIHDETRGVQDGALPTDPDRGPGANPVGDDVTPPLPDPLRTIHARLCGEFEQEIPVDSLQAMGTIPLGAAETIALDPVVDGVDSGLNSDGSDVRLFNFDSNVVIGVNGQEQVVFIVYLDDSTGAVWFVQCAPIDHDNPNNPDEAGDEAGTGFADETVNLSYTVTGSGGSVSAPLVIEVQDDGPTLTVEAGAEAAAGLVTELDETLGADRYNFSLAETEDAGGNANTDDGVGLGQVTTSVTGGLTTLFTVGGDAGFDGEASLSGVLSFVGLPTDGTPVATNLSATDGGAISLVYLSATQINGVDAAGTGDVVFTIEIVGAPGSEQIQTTLFEAIDHGDDSNLYDSELSLLLASSGAVQLQCEVTRTDKDGDSITEADQIDLVTDLDSVFSFDDDGPTASIELAGGSVTHDETPGLDGDADDTNNAGVTALFDGVVAAPLGDDPDVTGTGAIGYAQSAGAVVNGTSSGGADGVQSEVFSLDVSAAGVDSGLDTTEGFNILLYKEGDLVVGRVSGGANDDQAAFAVAIDPITGVVSVVQYLSLYHGDDTNPDDTVSITNGALLATVTVTDGDGDTDTTSIGIGSQVSFEDDGPTQLLPDDAVLLNVVSDPESSDTEELNFLAGADGVGEFIFLGQNGGANEIDGVQAQSKDGTPLTSNTLPIYLFGFGTDTLVASTDATFDIGGFNPLDPNATGDVVYVVMLDDTTGQYTVTMYDIVDGGQTTTFPDLTGTGPAGNITFKVIVGDSGTEILVHPLDANGSIDPAKTINSDSNDIGNTNQWISEAQGLQIDIGQFTIVGTGFTVQEQENIDFFEFKLWEVTGGPTTTSNLKISVLDDLDDPADNDVGDAVLIPLDRSNINVFDIDGTTAIIVDGVVQAGYPDVQIAEIGGSIYLIGMKEQWTIEVDGGGSTFDEIKIEDARRLVLKGDPAGLTGATFLTSLGLSAGDILTLDTVVGSPTNFTVLPGSTVADLITAWEGTAGIANIEIADDGSLVIFITEDFNGPTDITLSDNSGSDLMALLGLAEGSYEASADDFSFGGLEFRSGEEGNEITLNYDVEGSDGDDDTITGDLDIVLAPNEGVSILGTDGNDGALSGTGDVDFIYGLDGDDVINGMAGADQIDGGKGADNLTGGLGADVFIWASPNDLDDDGTGTFDGSVSVVDTITDFRDSEGDTLDVSDLLSEIGDPGNVNGSVQVVLGAGDTVEVQVDLTGTGVGTFETFVIVDNVDSILQSDLRDDVQLALTVA